MQWISDAAGEICALAIQHRDRLIRAVEADSRQRASEYHFLADLRREIRPALDDGPFLAAYLRCMAAASADGHLAAFEPRLYELRRFYFGLWDTAEEGKDCGFGSRAAQLLNDEICRVQDMASGIKIARKTEVRPSISLFGTRGSEAAANTLVSIDIPQTIEDCNWLQATLRALLESDDEDYFNHSWDEFSGTLRRLVARLNHGDLELLDCTQQERMHITDVWRNIHQWEDVEKPAFESEDIRTYLIWHANLCLHLNSATSWLSRLGTAKASAAAADQPLEARANADQQPVDIEQFIQAAGDSTSVQILRIMNQQGLDLNEKLLAIFRLDIRYTAKDSKQLAVLLGVTSGRVRQLPAWKSRLSADDR
ncbi:MAG TPA: hypothetical protein VGG64_13600 [Pirellulales bacterium]|jgi:hypothetical protein